MPELLVIRPCIDAAAAVDRVRELCGGAAALERELLYPYHHFGVRGRLRSLFGAREVSAECLVDARTGHAATADAFTVVRRSCGDEGCLAPIVSATEARRRAERYSTHALGRAWRIAADFRLELTVHGIVHRPFCVVAGGGRRLLVDRVTGEMHPLNNLASAA